MPVAINHLPTCCSNTVDEIIVIFAYLSHSVDYCCLAAICTNEFTINNFKGVACCLNDCTPINYGLTTVTVGTTRVAVLCTSCSLICYSGSSVYMPCSCIIDFSCNVKCRIETFNVGVISSVEISNCAIGCFTLNIDNRNCL